MHNLHFNFQIYSASFAYQDSLQYFEVFHAGMTLQPLLEFQSGDTPQLWTFLQT